MKQLRLYHRDGCHLCEDMLDQLEPLHRQADFNCLLIDVDSDEALRMKYHERVPVLENEEGELLCEVFLDPIRILNYLQDA